MSNWSAELIDITQPEPHNPDNDNNRDDEQDQALPSAWTDQGNYWSGKTYDTVRPISSLKPVPAQPLLKGDEDSMWSEHLHPHNYRAKAPLQSHPLNLLQVGPKASGPTLPFTRGNFITY